LDIDSKLRSPKISLNRWKVCWPRPKQIDTRPKSQSARQKLCTAICDSLPGNLGWKSGRWICT